MVRILALSVLFLGLPVGGCGSDSGGSGGGAGIASGTLSGKVGGVAWTFAQGDTDSFLSDEEKFFTALYDGHYTACDRFSAPNGNTILVGVPTQVGEYALGFQQTMTFVVGDTNLIATDGVIVVESVTDTSVEAGMRSRFDTDNEVNGRFTVDLCP